MKIPILKLFKKSPFKPLRFHMEKSLETLSFLKPLFDYLSEGDYEKIEETAEKIYKLEHECDKIKDEIRDHLPKTLFLPFARTDFLSLIHEQDEIPDKVEDIAVLLTLKRIRMPEEIKEEFYIFLERVLETVKQAVEIVKEMDLILESSFSKKEIEKVHSLIDLLEEMEWKADKKACKVTKIILSLENKLSFVEMLLWMNIIKELSALADHAESMGKSIRLMIAKV